MPEINAQMKNIYSNSLIPSCTCCIFYVFTLSSGLCEAVQLTILYNLYKLARNPNTTSNMQNPVKIVLPSNNKKVQNIQFSMDRAEGTSLSPFCHMIIKIQDIQVVNRTPLVHNNLFCPSSGLNPILCP